MILRNIASGSSTDIPRRLEVVVIDAPVSKSEKYGKRHAKDIENTLVIFGG